MTASKRPRVSVHFACNDEHGNQSNRIEYVDVDDDGTRLALEGPGLTYREGAVLVVGRRHYAHHGIAEWVGNWCWNAATVDRHVAHQIVAYLVEERGWRATEWPCEGEWSKYGERDVPTVVRR